MGHHTAEEKRNYTVYVRVESWEKLVEMCQESGVARGHKLSEIIDEAWESRQRNKARKSA